MEKGSCSYCDIDNFLAFRKIYVAFVYVHVLSFLPFLSWEE